MATPNYNFKEAILADNPAFPKASSDNYNENLNKIDAIFSDSYFSETLTASETKAVDSIVASSNMAVTWLIFLNESVGDKQSYLQIMAIYKSSTVRFHKFGHVHISKVSFDMDVDLDSGNLRLLVTNNESAGITVDGRRISPFLKTTF